MFYRDFIPRELAPGWLQTPKNAAWLRASGDLKDSLGERCKDAVKVRFARLAPRDGLDQLGGDHSVRASRRAPRRPRPDVARRALTSARRPWAPRARYESTSVTATCSSARTWRQGAAAADGLPARSQPRAGLLYAGRFLSDYRVHSAKGAERAGILRRGSASRLDQPAVRGAGGNRRWRRSPRCEAPGSRRRSAR